MPRKHNNNRQGDSETKPSTVVEQLEMLRNFVSGGEQSYSETDLIGSLRQSGFNVQRAAERLMTGQYKKAPPYNKMKQTGSTTVATAATTSQESEVRTGPKYQLSQTTPSTTAFPLNKSQGKNRASAVPNTMSTKVQLDATSMETVVYADDGNIATVSTTAACVGWMLCQRWVSDAICLTNKGRIQHKEQLTFTHSVTGYPVVRFRASGLEGKLSERLSTLLTPLLRQHEPATSVPVKATSSSSSSLIFLTGEALMADRGLAIGAHIPIAITVWIPFPRAFFDLFSDLAGSFGSSSGNDWIGRKGRPKRQLPLAKAAFELLQWAEYGNAPNFSPVSSPADVNESNTSSVAIGDQEPTETVNLKDDGLAVGLVDKADEANIDDVEIDEEDFEAASVAEISVQANELAQSVVHDTDWWSSLPEADDPTGFRDVKLRPYQKQALYWMSKRENEGETGEELENQLSLLSELVGANQSAVTRSPYVQQPKGQDVTCDCGPVVLSEEAKSRSRSLDGQVNPMNHPLWNKRYLTTGRMDETCTFYVNELLGLASPRPPDPPKPCSGGILADAMGLGKTVMLMALIIKSKHDRLSLGSTGPSATLVVAKLSLLGQWEDELRTKTSLSYHIFYGQPGSKDLQTEELDGVDVVVTTYGTVQGELKRKNPVLLNYNWLRVVLDEAHCIRNQKTVASKVCCNFTSKYRWCVSGTIIQNSLDDVFGMMKFLKHEPWCWPSFWKAAVTSAVSQSAGDSCSPDKQDGSVAVVALDRVRRALGPIMLRRTKESLTKTGEPIVQLPPVETKTVQVELSENEREFYNAVLAKSRQLFEGYLQSGKVARSYIQIFALLQRLRQVCDHIALTVRTRIDEQDMNPAELKSVVKTDTGSPLRKKEATHDSLGMDFLQGLLEKFCSHQSPPRKHSRNETECVSMSKRTKPDPYLSSVAEKLTSAVSENSTNLNEECAVCLEAPLIESAVVTPCGHVFCGDCLTGYLRSLRPKTGDEQREINISLSIPDGSCPCCNEKVEAKRIVALSRSQENGRITTSLLYDSKRSKSREKQDEEKENIEHQRTIARQILENAVRGSTSSKLTAIMEELDKIWQLDPGSKVIVFSHYLGFLDHLEVQFRERWIPYCRLDGSLSLRERIAVLEQFRSSVNRSAIDLCIRSSESTAEGTTGSVLLMSMSAGAEGLNLVAASTCFICEPWWNAAREDQCVNRIHRIGQEAKLVRVRKFIVNNSVEERILELQRRKSFIADEVYNPTEQTACVDACRLSLEEFKQIFRK